MNVNRNIPTADDTRLVVMSHRDLARSGAVATALVVGVVLGSSFNTLGTIATLFRAEARALIGTCLDREYYRAHLARLGFGRLPALIVEGLKMLSDHRQSSALPRTKLSLAADFAGPPNKHLITGCAVQRNTIAALVGTRVGSAIRLVAVTRAVLSEPMEAIEFIEYDGGAMQTVHNYNPITRAIHKQHYTIAQVFCQSSAVGAFL